MQEFPKWLPKGSKIGVITLKRDYWFTTLKNNLNDAGNKFKAGLPW